MSEFRRGIEREIVREVKETKDLIDVNGELVCHADLIFKEGEEGTKNKRLLTSAYIRHPESGKRINIFDLVDVSIGGEGCEVHIVVDESKKQYGAEFSPYERKVFIGEIKSHVNIVGLLHELGHVEQCTEEAYAQLVPDYIEKQRQIRILGENAIPYNTQLFDSFLGGIPDEFKDVLDSGMLEKYREKVVEREALQRELFGLKDERDDLNEWRANILGSSLPSMIDRERIKKRIKNIDTELVALATQIDIEHGLLSVAASEGMSTAYRLPIFILESDATRRALEWMKRVQEEVNVNLFVEARDEEYGTIDPIQRLRLDYECYTTQGQKPPIPFPNIDTVV